jgi:protein gp37
VSENSAIEWTDHTWSPVWGCTEVSKAETGGGGCDNCYARTLAHRFGYGWNGAPMRLFGDDHWDKPAQWNRRAAAAGQRPRVFPSMCDPFDKNWPLGVRVRFWALIEETPNLTWLLLTKRVGNVRDMAPERWLRRGGWPAHVWLGATVVNQPEADRDVDKLAALPAPVRFLSIEPMLGPIDLSRWLDLYQYDEVSPWSRRNIGVTAALQWVIAGGESGPKARPAHPDWFRSLRDQCAAAGVAFMFKQWGEWVPDRQQGKHAALAVLSNQPIPPTVYLRELDATTRATKVGKKAAGRLLDGVTHDGFPGAAP